MANKKRLISVNGLDANDLPISNVGTPSGSTDAANKAYVDGLVAGLLDDRGSYDASVNTWPTTGGSGAVGAVMKGDLWYVSVAGTLGGVAVNVGDSFRALSDAPGQTAANWAVLESNLGFVPYPASNPSGFTSNAGTVTDVTATGPLVSTGGATPNLSMPAATSSAAGHMTAAQVATLEALDAVGIVDDDNDGLMSSAMYSELLSCSENKFTNVLATPGSFGSGTTIPVFTVDAKGVVTAITEVPVETTVTNSMDLESGGLTSFSTTLATAAANQVCWSTPADTFSTMKMLVEVTNGVDFHSCEMSFIVKGTAVYMVEYGTLYSASALASFDAVINAGNFELKCSPLGANYNVTGVITGIFA